jgi:hypothetical protein
MGLLSSWRQTRWTLSSGGRVCASVLEVGRAATGDAAGDVVLIAAQRIKSAARPRRHAWAFSDTI